MGRIIKILIVVAILAGLLYTGYWFMMAGRLETEVRGWFEDRTEEGYAVEIGALEVGGFPGAFTVAAESFSMGAPNGDWRAATDRLAATTASPFALTDWMIEPAEDFTVEIASDAGPVVLSATNGRMRVLETPEGAWRASAAADAIDIETGAPNLVTEIFGDRIRKPQLLIGTETDEAERVEIETARMVWGAADLEATGELGADEAGYLDGELDLALADPAAFLAALVEAGVMEQQEATLANAFLALAPKNEDGATVIPIAFRDRRTFIGPIPAGDAPRLHAPETNS